MLLVLYGYRKIKYIGPGLLHGIIQKANNSSADTGFHDLASDITVFSPWPRLLECRITC